MTKTAHPPGAAPTPSELLRTTGLRVTPQRQLVLEVLAHAGPHHLSADEVWQEVRGRFSNFNRSTVYRVLDLLVASGVVAQHFLGDTVARYELSTAVVHHHLVCRQCRTVFDLDPRSLRSLTEAARSTHQFVVGTIGLTIEGLCAACATPMSSNAAPA